MIFALALGILATPRWRPFVAIFGGLLTIATVYSLLILGSHYPSDVLVGSALGAAIGAGMRRRLLSRGR